MHFPGTDADELTEKRCGHKIYNYFYQAQPNLAKLNEFLFDISSICQANRPATRTCIEKAGNEQNLLSIICMSLAIPDEV